MHYVYTYREPAPSTSIFYVGKGQRGRAWSHLYRTDKHPLAQRLQKMLREGRPPVVDLWPAESEEHAFEMEARLVALLGTRREGTGALLNLCDGGRGGVASALRGVKKSETHRKNISAGRKGIGHSPEARAKISAVVRSRKDEFAGYLEKARAAKKPVDSAETRRKKSEAGKKTKGKKKSPEHKAALRRAWEKRRREHGPARPKGFTVPAEVREKIRQKLLGGHPTPEAYAKQVAGLRSPEARAKNSAVRKGKALSPEHRAKIADALRRPEVKAKLKVRRRRKF